MTDHPESATAFVERYDHQEAEPSRDDNIRYAALARIGALVEDAAHSTLWKMSEAVPDARLDMDEARAVLAALRSGA